MATILRAIGNQEQYDAATEHITIQEISRLVNGLIEPTFIGEYWFFSCKNAQRLKRDFNEPASQLLGLEIFGDVVIAKDTELSPSFFFPPGVVDEIRAMGKNVAKKIIQENPELVEENLTEEQKEEAMEVMMEEGYKNLLRTPRSFMTIMKNFEIYNDGKQLIKIPPIKEERIKALDTLIDYFTKKEKYEKCADLIKFKEKMIEFYEEF